MLKDTKGLTVDGPWNKYDPHYVRTLIFRSQHEILDIVVPLRSQNNTGCFFM